MEPRIQYALTSDDVSIACWSLGEGLPILHVPPSPWSHLQFEWQDPDYRAWFERLASVARLIRFDSRGSGLSDRDVSESGLEALMLDIDAVADRMGVERFALVGVSIASCVAIAYAATRPERVSHLLLWCGYAAQEEMQTPQMEAIAALAQTDFTLFTETVAHAMVAGWEAPAAARRFARLMREAIDPEAAAALLDCVRPIDVQELLPKVQAPTLVMQRSGVQLPPAAVARRLAARIPGAELAMFEGNAVLPYVGDADAVHRAIERFLGLPPSAPAVTPAAHGPESASAPGSAREASRAARTKRRQTRLAPFGQVGLRTILFTDLEGHTAMMQQLGDEGGRELLREHERVTREALREYGGSEVKAMGDGFLASFASAQKALDCSMALQERWAGACANLPVELRVRIGINAGEPIAEDDDLFGTAVIAAARIAALAGGGEVLVANVVRELVAGKGFLFADRGEVLLRGFEDATRLYELRWRG